MKTLLPLILALTVIPSLASAQDLRLPAPQKTGGKPLMQALAERKSTRQYANRDLDQQTLANLLWAAYGFNREDKRTVPSSQNRQEIDLYVFLKSGVYLYDAKANTLIAKASGDHRKTAGTQEYVATAPLNLVYVANLDKASNRDAACIDCGFIGQNVYLFCASENLVTVLRAGLDKKALSELLKLNANQEALYNQCVGYPPVP
ncbi:MAG: SagB/ThcOx family dehydrogenase [Verrucomicrobiales bacterium]|jgi:nitroreductase|nr:SagB/ThcOx family dehydrogenase [Verrucomicrobiales bacterium]